MTRPGHVMVEFPVEEAEALLHRAQTGEDWIDDDRLKDAVDRLQLATNIERGPGGSAPQPVDPALEKAA